MPVHLHSPAERPRPARAIVVVSPSAERRREWREALEDAYVVHVVPSRRVLGQRVASLRPDVALLDDRLLGRAGSQPIAEVRHRSPATRVLIAGSRADPRMVVGALRAGARGWCPADASPLLLRRAIRRVEKGEVWVSRRLVSHLVDELADLTEARQLGLMDSPVPGHLVGPLRLSSREADVVRYVAAGRSNRAIAEALGLAEKTVKSHLTSIFRKLRVSSRLQLAILARRSHGGQLTTS